MDQTLRDDLLETFSSSNQMGTAWGERIMQFMMEDTKIDMRDNILSFLSHKFQNDEELQDAFNNYFSKEVPPVFEFDNVETQSDEWFLRLKSEITRLNAHFVAGGNRDTLLKIIRKFNLEGFEITVNLLGEGSINASQIKSTEKEYKALIHDWKNLVGDVPFAWESKTPKIHISMKPSSFYIAESGCSVEELVQDVLPIYRHVIANQGFLNIDMERYENKDFFIDLYKRLRSHPDVRHYPHLGLVQQAYLKDCESDVRCLLEWARTENLPIAIRLVKGAYWKEESTLAKTEDIESPVWLKKEDTDRSYERIASEILRNRDICYYACASHNMKTIQYVLSCINEYKIPSDRYEFQILYGMLQSVQNSLKEQTPRLRIYCPYGSDVYGFPYIVRRLLEKTDENSFLRSVLRFQK